MWSERCKPTRCWTDAEVRRRQTCLHVVAARCLPVTSNPPVFQDQPSASYWTHDKSDWTVRLEILSCLTGQCIENSLWCWEQVVSFSGNQIHFPLCLCTPCAFAYPRRGSTWCHLAGLSVFWEIRVVICDSVSVIVATLSRLWKNNVWPCSTDPCIFSFVFLVHWDHWGPLLLLLSGYYTLSHQCNTRARLWTRVMVCVFGPSVHSQVCGHHTGLWCTYTVRPACERQMTDDRWLNIVPCHLRPNSERFVGQQTTRASHCCDK